MKRLVYIAVASLVVVLFMIYFYLQYQVISTKKAQVASGRTNQTELEKIISRRFDDNYKSRVETYDSSIVTTIESNCPASDTCNLDVMQKPLIAIEDYKTHTLLSVFEVGLNKYNKPKLNVGNNIWLENIYHKNRDYKDFDFLTEWVHYEDGMAFKAIALFKNVQNKILPVSGYPENMAKDDTLTLTELKSGKIYTLPMRSGGYPTYFKDLNGDGKTDMLSVRWEVLNGEKQYQARPRLLKVYELNDSSFQTSAWWNKGQEYKTENIEYDDQQRQIELAKFDSIFNPNICNKVNNEGAVNLVKNRPEVQSYLGLNFPTGIVPILTLDHSTEKYATIHVFESVKEGTLGAHLTTFNWYTVNKCEGGVQCSFSDYDAKGNFIKVSSQYPCE